MAINAFSNLTISVSDGGTVPSLDYLANKTFVDIGSGNVLKVSWNTPAATNNAVDNYKLTIVRYDSASGSYKSLYSANIGNVNEYYVKSALFKSLAQSLIPLQIYVEAISKYGSAYNGKSNTVSVNVGKGSGSYTKVTDGYTMPVMKRTLAFAQLDYKALSASNGNLIAASDVDTIYVKATSTHDTTTGWALMQEFYAKDANGNWKSSDIQYEALTDANGEPITDPNNEIVYVL